MPGAHNPKGRSVKLVYVCMLIPPVVEYIALAQNTLYGKCYVSAIIRYM